VPLLQQEEPSVVLLVRPRPGADTPVDAVKRAVWSVSPAQALFGIEPFASLASERMAEHRSVALLLGAFALLAVVMSITGVYTVVAYLVSRRTREIALRRAIGATGADVLSLLAGQTFRWTLGGVAAGIAGAVAGSGSLRAAVAGVVPLEPATLFVIAIVYMVVVAVAVGVPALRALRLDPATALRAE
jgi:ABC-type antimicrobial peptide transport system permease subunit